MVVRVAMKKPLSNTLLPLLVPTEFQLRCHVNIDSNQQQTAGPRTTAEVSFYYS